MAGPVSASSASYGHLAPIETATLQRRAFVSISEALLSGRFRSGETVSLRSLSTALGVSVMPIREAIHSLIAVKALEQSGKRGARVPLMSAAERADLWRLRRLMELAAAGKAGRKPSKAGAERLDRSLDDCRTAAEVSDIGGLQLARYGFFTAISDEYASETLASMIRSIWLTAAPQSMEIFESLIASAEGGRIVEILERARAAVHAGSRSDLAAAIGDDIEIASGGTG